MNLEKLGLLFLINYFNQLGDVKNHLLMALKEVLMAMQTSFDIISKSASPSVMGHQFEPLAPVFRQVQSLITFAIEKVAPYDTDISRMSSQETLRLKENIVNSIVSAIDDEIENTRGTSNEKNKLKIEALQTVKQVLINQRKKPVTTPSSTSTKDSFVA